MENLIGKSLGRYHILEQLGEGGMATVFKAYDTNLEREVAVKIIRREAFPPEQSDHLLKRFEREAKALAQLVHPNIVNVIDYGSQDGNPYLVMNFLPGGTLKDRLGKPMPWPEAVKLLLPVAEALDYAHSRNIIHRDVKPSNILLTQRGQPLLTDFGIAKILEVGEATQLTATGVGIGTPDYMAPEQWTGTVGPQTDIYSLGVVLYQMVTGRLPFIADTPAAVLIKHARDPLPSPKSIVPDLPDEVEQVLIKALAKEPENRYRDMGAFVEALGKLSREAPTVLASAAVPAEALQGTLISPPVPVEPGKAEAAPAAQPVARKRNWLVWFAAGLGVLVLVGAAIVLFINLRHPAAPIPTALGPAIKVGEVTDVGGMNENYPNALAWKGVSDAVSQLGINGVFLESTQPSDYSRNIQQMLSNQEDLIVTVPFLAVDTAAAARANPARKFAIADYSYPDCYPDAVEGTDCGSATDLANVRGLAFQIDQPAFLAGYLAAGMTGTGKVASFGGLQIPTVTLFMKGFEAGVKYYNQGHGTSVVALGWDDKAQAGIFAGNFSSTADGQTTAASLVLTGADILMPVAGQVGLGSAAYCQTTGMCLIIGVDTDWFVSYPEYAGIELTSVQKKIDLAVFQTIQDVVNGKFTGGTVTYTLADGGVDLAPFHDFDSQVPQTLKDELTKVRADIVSGAVTVDAVLATP